MTTGKKILIGALVVVGLGSGYLGLHTTIQPAGLTAKIAAAKPPVPVVDPTAKTKTWCTLQCGDVPFAGFHCIMVCMTCSTDFGGGCRITIYPPN